jgi:hypothetical protein
MFIWNIDNEKYHKGYPYKNILKILGKHTKIAVNYSDNIIEFTFIKYNNDGLKKYIELVSVNKNERTDLFNIQLNIYDKHKYIYIANISKSENIAGKKFVKLAELIAKKLGASHTYLNDGTNVLCNNDAALFNEVDLTLYLLFKNKKTYYQQLGYKLDLSYNYSSMDMQPNKSADKTFEYFIKKIHKLNLNTIHKNNNLVLKELKQSIINNSKIMITSSHSGFKKQEIKNNYALYTDFLVYSNIYNFLPQKGNFITELLKIYTTNCNMYNFIINTITNYIVYNRNQFGYKYEFIKKTYQLDEIFYLSIFLNYRDNIGWNGYFIKKL